MIKSISNTLVLILIGLGLITGLIELAVWINRPFIYLLSAGLSVLVILGAFEILERAKE